MSTIIDDLLQRLPAWEKENVRLRQEAEVLKSDLRHARSVMEQMLAKAEKLGDDGLAAYQNFREEMRELIRRHS